MVKYTFLTIVVSLVFSIHDCYTQNFTEEEIILETPTGNLYGTLTIPVKGKKHSLALIISGSGPTDRDGNSIMMHGKNNSLQMLSHELGENKIASVRFDKRGVSASRKSGFSEQDLRFDHYVYDVVFWLRKLNADNRFKKVGIIGHSEGSLIGMVAATKEKTDFYISIAGAAVPANEIISQQLAGQDNEIKIDADRIMDKLNEGFTVDSINPMLFSIFRPSVQPYLISWFAYNPAKIIKNLEVPILIVQGTSDIQIETENGKLLTQASNNSRLVEIENMNHILKITGNDMAQNIAAYTNPDLALAPGLSNEVASFIKKGK